MASWKKVIMEDSAAALASLTLTTDLAIAHGGTGASTVGDARTNLGLGSAATTAASAYATSAQGTRADNALPVSGGSMTGNITFNGSQAKGNSGLVPAAPSSSTTKFLRGDGTFEVPAYSTGQLTTEQVQDIAGGLAATGGTKTGITVTYDDANGNMDFEVASTYLNSNVTLGTLGAQPLDEGLTSIAGLTTAADKMIYATASDSYAVTSLTSFARTLLDDANAGTARTTLGVVNNVNPSTDSSSEAVLSFSGAEMQATDPGVNADHFVIWDDSGSSLAYLAGNGAKTLVGLGNATNTSDANKPVSTAQQTALNLKATIASPTFTGTVGGVTKAHVGLGNATNTSDANKPVSTAQQTALDLKSNLASPTFTGTAVFNNITISGTQTTVNTETIDLADNFINLNSNETGTPSQDAGISIDRGTTTDANLFWDEAVDRWSLSLANLGGSDTASTPNAFVGVIQQATTAAASLAAPLYGGTGGLGTIYVKTDTSDVYIYA